MTTTKKSPSACIRERLDHPIIDSDGHFVEFFPVVADHLKRVGGSDMVERFEHAWNQTPLSRNWYGLSWEERRDSRTVRPAFWNVATRNTEDLATSILPDLLHARLDEMGLDFVILYPGLGLICPHFADDEVRQATCRALNEMYAEVYTGFPKRMTPVATIPMHTPDEAIAELEYAVGKLGLKGIVMPSFVPRPIPKVAREAPEAAPYAAWMDSFGIDSPYDYDPVWAKCEELKVLPSFHSSAMGWGSRTSISSYVYNHIGHFATAQEAVCKALLLGGVTRRFPRLRFLLLEGGIGWGRNLYADAIGHWRKRGREGLKAYDPANLDRAKLAELFARYGGKLIGDRQISEGSEVFATVTGTAEDPATLDEFARCAIESDEDFRQLFLEPFYFGCEADDPMTPSAFDVKANPLGARLNAVLGSDIGHWDVPDMSRVLEEAWEPVEEGLMSERDFHDFAFANSARLWSSLNPDFFKGTVVEGAVTDLLSNA